MHNIEHWINGSYVPAGDTHAHGTKGVGFFTRPGGINLGFPQNS